MSLRGAQIVQLDRRLVAADAARLDVDDPAGARRDRVARDAHGVNRLVEADRRRDALLQRRMIHHIVVIERLLDQQQVERIEPRQQRRVVERVGGVGVDLQRNVAELSRERARPRRCPSPA